MKTSDVSRSSTWLLRLMTLAVTLILCTHICAQRDSSIYQVVEPFPDTHISQNHIRYSTREIREDVNAVAIGQMNVLDTYLSPAEYTGTGIRYISHSTRRTPGGSPVSRQLVHQGSIADLEDRAGKGSEISGLYDLSFGLHYNWVPFANCLLQIGGQFEGSTTCGTDVQPQLRTVVLRDFLTRQLRPQLCADHGGQCPFSAPHALIRRGVQVVYHTCGIPWRLSAGESQPPETALLHPCPNDRFREKFLNYEENEKAKWRLKIGD